MPSEECVIRCTCAAAVGCSRQEARQAARFHRLWRDARWCAFAGTPAVAAAASAAGGGAEAAAVAVAVAVAVTVTSSDTDATSGFDAGAASAAGTTPFNEGWVSS